jgi:cell wall-associated NlpC family hydrolase
MEYLDLLSVPYKLHGRMPRGLDCSTVCEEVLNRLGLSPPPTSPFRYPASAGELGEFEKYMMEASARMERLGRCISLATKPGDLVLTASHQNRGMYVYVGDNLFLTAQPRVGVSAHSRSAIQRTKPKVLGVYRCAATEHLATS